MGPGKRADPQAFYPAEMNMRAQRARSLARFAGPRAPCIAFRMEGPPIVPGLVVRLLERGWTLPSPLSRSHDLVARVMARGIEATLWPGSALCRLASHADPRKQRRQSSLAFVFSS
jgi:hypothetical protein